MSTATVSALDKLIGGVQDALVERTILSVTVRQAVAMTGLSERYLRRLIAEGKIRSSKLGAKRLLKLEDVKRLVGAK